jgi:hypothetical protein
MVEILGWVVQAELLRMEVEPVPRMHTILEFLHTLLEAMVVVVVVQQKTYLCVMEVLPLHLAVSIALDMEIPVEEEDRVAVLNLVAVAVALAELALMPGLEPVEMVGVERMLFPLG